MLKNFDKSKSTETLQLRDSLEGTRLSIRNLKNYFSVVLFFYLSLFVIWESLVDLSFIPAYLIPAPSQILNSYAKEPQEYLTALVSTFIHSSLGITLSVTIGLGLALASAIVEAIRKVLLPLAIFFQTVPIIAIAPLLVIYFGFGGPTVIASSFIVSIFPVLANTMIGLEKIPQNHLELFKLMGASQSQILWRLRLPHAFTPIMTGIRVAMGLSIIGTIAGEFVGGGGLGAMIDSARTQQRVEIVYGCLFLLSLMGIFFLKIQELINRLFLRWKPLEIKSSH